MSQDSKKLKITHENGALTEEDERYFQSYGLLQCHQTMVSDTRRTNAFRHSILKSYQRLYKRTVLEIGCGTGILSIFACQAGASRVYAVEASDSFRYAQKVIARNGFADRVHLVQCKVEDFDLPSNEKVDAIISEWMGYGLFCEWMLPSVISTRDRLLKKDGLLFPNKVTVHIALARETDYVRSRAEYWQTEPKQDYKMDMEVLAEEEYKDVIGKMAIHAVEPTEIISGPCELLSLNLHTIKCEECDCFTADFRLTAFGSCDVYGFCLWFKTFFPADIDLDTSPFCPSTHWMQTMLYVPPFGVKQDSVVFGSLTFRRHPKSKRMLAIDLKFALDDGERKMYEMQFLDLLDA